MFFSDLARALVFGYYTDAFFFEAHHMETGNMYVEWNMPRAKTDGLLGSLETVQAVLGALGRTRDDATVLVKLKKELTESEDLAVWLHRVWMSASELYTESAPPTPWRIFKVGSEQRVQRRFLDLVASDLVVHGMAVAFVVFDKQTVAGFVLEEREDQNTGVYIYDAGGYAMRHRAFVVLLASGLFGEDLSMEEVTALVKETRVPWP